MVMEALAEGWPGGKLIKGDPPNDAEPFAVYGQTWGAERLLPPAIKDHRPFWHIDNGFWHPGRGSDRGYYRMSYRSMMPVFLPDVSDERARATKVQMKPWRKTGSHILFATPGREYGRALGLRMDLWTSRTHTKLRRSTDRRIVMRDKGCKIPLDVQLRDCWALVTHSSNVAVEAVLAGVPVIVAEGAAAAPVGLTSVQDVDNPVTPDRDAWWASLLCQQFTPAEMASGLAYEHLSAVRDMVDQHPMAA